MGVGLGAGKEEGGGVGRGLWASWVRGRLHGLGGLVGCGAGGACIGWGDREGWRAMRQEVGKVGRMWLDPRRWGLWGFRVGGGGGVWGWSAVVP